MPEIKSLQDLVARSGATLDDYEASQADNGGERAPQPGDVYVLEVAAEHGIEWVVVAHDPADASRFLVAPADGNIQAGSADVHLTNTPLGALVVRCRLGTWIDVKYFGPSKRAGVLQAGDVVRVRQKWLDLGDGKATGSVMAQEVDEDPAYRDWIDDVVIPARQALQAASASPDEPLDDAEDDVLGNEPPIEIQEIVEEPRSMRGNRSSRWILLKVAAGVFVAVGALQIWRLEMSKITRQHFEAVEKYELRVEGLEGELRTATADFADEREAWASERERLKAELENTGGAAQETERLRQQIAELDQRLSEEAAIVNPAVVVLDEPGAATRGRVEVDVRPDSTHVMMVLPLGLSAPAPSYKAEVRRLDGTLVWATDKLAASDVGELWIGLPASVLGRGRHVLVVSAMKDGAFAEMGRYQVDVRIEE